MVQIFTVDISSCLSKDLSEATPFLTQERAEKVQRYKSVSDAWLSVFSELLIRFAASEKYGVPQHEIRFYKNGQGKPFLHNDPFQFNVSHSGNWVALAVTDNENIGIDIELKRPMRRLLPLAKRFFSEKEHEYITSKDEPIDSFFKIWTMKESYLKCTGTGIAYSLSSFSVPVGEEEEFTAGKWKFFSKDFEKNYKICVCVEGRPEIDKEIMTLKGADLLEHFRKSQSEGQ